MVGHGGGGGEGGRGREEGEGEGGMGGAKGDGLSRVPCQKRCDGRKI